jgi:hypothetical protein
VRERDTERMKKRERHNDKERETMTKRERGERFEVNGNLRLLLCAQYLSITAGSWQTPGSWLARPK